MAKITITIEDAEDGAMDIIVRNEVDGVETPVPDDDVELTDAQKLAAMCCMVMQRATTPDTAGPAELA